MRSFCTVHVCFLVCYFCVANFGLFPAKAQFPHEKSPQLQNLVSGSDIDYRVIKLVSAIIETNIHAESETQVGLIESVKELGTEAVPTLIGLSENGDHDARLVALDILGQLGKAAEPAIPVLRRQFVTPDDSRISPAAAKAILNIQPIEGPMILVKANNEADPQFNYSNERRGIDLAQLFTESVKANSQSVCKALYALLDSQHENVRIAAAEGLLKREAPLELETARQAVLKMVNDESIELRLKGLQWLRDSKTRLDSPEIRTALKRSLDSRFDEQRWTTAAAAIRLEVYPTETNAVMDHAILFSQESDRERVFALFGSNLLPRFKMLLDGTCDIEVERRAIPMLGMMRSNSQEAVSLLVKALSKEELRLAAIHALGKLGTDAASAVPSLILALDYKEYRNAAIVALGKIGPGAKEATPMLTRLLEEEVRFIAMVSLGKIGPIPLDAVPILLKMIDEEQVGWRGELLHCRDIRAAEAVPELIQLWRKRASERGDYVESFCEEALVNIGKPSVPALIEAIEDQNPHLRNGAIKTLSQIGSGAIAAFPRLVDLLDDKDPIVRHAALKALIQIDKQSEIAKRILIGVLANGDAAMCSFAASTLKEQINTNDSGFVSDLVKHLGSASQLTRVEAAILLGKIGPHAKEALPALEDLSNVEVGWEEVGWEESGWLPPYGVDDLFINLFTSFQSLEPPFGYLDSMRRIGGYEAMLPPLIRRLRTAKNVDYFEIDEHIFPDELDDSVAELLIDTYRNGDSVTRRAVLHLLCYTRSNAESRIMKLAFRDPDPQVHGSAISAAITKPAMAVDVIPELVEALDHPRLRYSAVHVIEMMGPKAKLAVPKLIESLTGWEGNVQDVVKALEKIGPDAHAAAPKLIQLLADDRYLGYPERRFLASAVTKAFDAIGCEKEAIVPALVASLKDPNARVRSNAAQSLGILAADDNMVADWGAVAHALANGLDDQHGDVRNDVAIALSSIGADAAPAVPALIQSLEGGNSGIDYQIYRALASIGPSANAAVPALTKSLKSSDSKTRQHAVSTLSNLLTPGDRQALPLLIDSLLDPSMHRFGQLRSRTLTAIDRISDGTETGASAAIRQLKSSGTESRLTAILALSEIARVASIRERNNFSREPPQMKPYAEEWIPSLIFALEDDEIEIRLEAASVICYFGPNAKSAVQTLKRGLSDQRLAKSYRQALKQIDPEWDKDSRE